MFTRQEALKITNISNNFLSYLDKTDMVKPLKNGRKYSYNWLQLIEIKSILKMRAFVSLKTLREAKRNLEDLGVENNNYSNKNLVAFDRKIYFLTDNIEKFVIEITGKHLGQGVIYEVLPINSIIQELISNGSNIIDFKQKLKEDGFTYPEVREIIKHPVAV